jgi:uncharacterized membrane protein required for colicin V production
MPVTTWPNWVDLIIVTILLRTSYNGFGRGLLAEIFSLGGAISVTTLAINYSNLVTQWVRPWVWFDATVAGFVVFIGLFLILIFGVHLIIRRLTEVIKWERLHWAIQGLGLMLGALRGLWWSGVILAVLTASGVTYLQESVEQRSVLGPRLAQMARDSLERIADRFPGASLRGPVLIPPLRPTAHK